MTRTLYRAIFTNNGTIMHGNLEEAKPLDQNNLVAIAVVTYDVLPNRKSANMQTRYEDKDGNAIEKVA